MSMILAGSLPAAEPPASARTELSLLATGTVSIDAGGNVTAHQLDQPGKLPPAVTELVGGKIRDWKFAVDGGKPVTVPMTLRIVAHPIDKDHYQVGIEGASFEPMRPDRGNELAPPEYPNTLARRGVGGIVYLTLHVSPDGSVAQSSVDQVNLTTVGEEGQMRTWRYTFGLAAKRRSMGWHFATQDWPLKPGQSFHSVRVPVQFVAPGQSLKDYGQWEAYIPGPRTKAPWLLDDSGLFGGNALADGQMAVLGSGPRLLTQPEQSF
ncbi:hypothetical protein J2X06_000176 [Lysobacter niastensis]|uniref:Energy transducer TonB n=1 Tax=Lysobacter niastensis TaxID=380629 RepID=A0ABU1W6A6_9GAMM|nr:hypothetical protein [Lysobacter niastensis]MDR7132992.1 hypothetical protein [Lysobacter niastensis]